MLIALPPSFLPGALAGLEQLSRNGLRYPIPPYGAHMDPSEGMSKSYA